MNKRDSAKVAKAWPVNSSIRHIFISYSLVSSVPKNTFSLPPEAETALFCRGPVSKNVFPMRWLYVSFDNPAAALQPQC